MPHWTEKDIPDLGGRVALVTGANRGLGLEITRLLTTRGAHVIMAVRNLDQGRLAEAHIRQTVPDASLDVLSLDLSSLAAVRSGAAQIVQAYHRLDMLVNNAGVIAIPQRRETSDGFEMQFGTNHLGHFALTGLLAPLLTSTAGSRVVTMTSNARGSSPQIRFDDLQSEKAYSRWGAYAHSKRANLLFAFELQARFEAAGVSAISVAAHPGGANTNAPGTSSDLSAFERFVFGLISQSAAMGALSPVFAATNPQIRGGELVGPGGIARSRGYPAVDRSGDNEYNRPMALRLWEVSEELTGVTFEMLRPRATARP